MRRFFLNWWTLTLLAAVLVALLLALGLPIFVAFLRPWWVRLLLVLAVALIWGVFALVQCCGARAKSDAIAEEIAQPPQPGDEEAQVLSKRMTEAMAALKKASGDKRDYLYSRPWYVIIGPPGAGKTTALLNSGLRFPFADSALKGVGGTRNLDFWFADEAVLVDTAGRYTTQDSDAAVDARLVGAFPRAAAQAAAAAADQRHPRRHRPRRTAALRPRRPRRPRRRPCAGDWRSCARPWRSPPRSMCCSPRPICWPASSSSSTISTSRAAARWLGATLPWGRAPTARRPGRRVRRVRPGIADRTAKRLQDELDARRRGLILGFSAQVEGLRSRVLRFLDGAFIADREPVRSPCAASISPAASRKARRSTASSPASPRSTRRRSRTATGTGRAYFLNRLLGEVVFAEAGLVQTEPTARARRAARLTVALAGDRGVVGDPDRPVDRQLPQQPHFAAQSAGRRAGRCGNGSSDETGVDLVEVRDTDPDLEQALPVSAGAARACRGRLRRAQAHGRAAVAATSASIRTASPTRRGRPTCEALRRILLPRMLLRLETLPAAEPATQAFASTSR